MGKICGASKWKDSYRNVRVTFDHEEDELKLKF